jgi:hypothetical protein
MSCPQCGSIEVEEVKAEISIARENATTVYTCRQALLCSDCGFAQCLFEAPILAQLREIA